MCACQPGGSAERPLVQLCEAGTLAEATSWKTRCSRTRPMMKMIVRAEADLIAAERSATPSCMQHDVAAAGP